MKMLPSIREQNPIDLLRGVAIFVSVGTALIQLGRFLYIALSRITFPFTLEWMEGGSFIQVTRILAGQQLYVRPSFDFIPQIYPPFYYYLSALVDKIIGNHFVALRLISILSTIGIFILIYLLVSQHSGSRLAGLLASALFGSTYELSGYWFDIARVDSLALSLLLLSIYLFLKKDIRASILGGLVFALSCFTKQTMLITVGVFLVYSLLPPRKNHLVFIGTAALGYSAGTLLLNWLHEGWYSYYVFHLPGSHRVIPNIIKLLTSTNEILFSEIIKPILLAMVIGLVYLFLFPEAISADNKNTPTDGKKADKKWLQGAVWLVVIVIGLLALVAFGFLASLPSDVGKGLLGRYSLSRIVLMSGPVILAGLVIILISRMKKDATLVGWLAEKSFANEHTVPRVLLGYVILLVSAIVVTANLRSDLFDNLTTAHLQRLFPYLVGPLVVFVILSIAWRLLWPSICDEAWFFLLLGGGMIAISWLGRLNPGGYYNVFMPAFAGISIPFGMGIGALLQRRTSNESVFNNVISIVVLLFSGIQLLGLLSPPAPQIPTQADKEAGLELVSRIKACPGEVYVPFHTYLAELAGKDGYAGVVEMGELRGSFGGRPDPLWDEVLYQIQVELDAQTFEAVIQDNQIFRDAMSSNYIEAGRVFENDLVFWPIAGRKIRPEAVYQPINGESCLIKIK